jgi:hypothetical protein
MPWKANGMLWKKARLRSLAISSKIASQSVDRTRTIRPLGLWPCRCHEDEAGKTGGENLSNNDGPM